MNADALKQYRQECMVFGYINLSQAYKCMNVGRRKGQEVIKAYYEWLKEKGSEHLPNVIRTKSLFEFLQYRKRIHY